MDKCQAAKVLTENIVKNYGRLVIHDEAYKQKLLKESEHAYVINNSLDIFLERDFPAMTYIKRVDDKNVLKSQKIEELVDKLVPSEANYVFLSNKTPLSETKCLINMTPYAIIGDKEIEGIKRSFYKTYDPVIREAISSLGVKDFFPLYNTYMHNKDFREIFCNFEAFKKGFLEFLKKRTYDSSDDTRISSFDEDFGISQLNKQLKEMGINFSFPPIDKSTWVKRQSINGLIKQLENHTFDLGFEDSSKLEFLKFIFELPYEERNLEMDKFLFQKFNQYLDVNIIMLKEYQQGKYFKDLFEILKEPQQKMVINFVSQNSIQNQDYNHYLWMKGFKEIRQDYLKLYQEDAEGFINYFTDRCTEEKKVILKDIMECDSINDKVIEWLNNNESDLVREVGING